MFIAIKLCVNKKALCKTQHRNIIPRMVLTPMICGKWDACALWLQWSDVGDEYDVEVRLKKSFFEEWPDRWTPITPKNGKKAAWTVIQTWKEKHFAQARVRIKEGEWENAREIVFVKSKALFEISSQEKFYHEKEGFVFHCVVDGALCSYSTPIEFEIEPGEKKEIWLESAGATAWHQLDHENHFDTRPLFGLRVRNLRPSINDVKETGRDLTQIDSAAGEMFHIAAVK